VVGSDLKAWEANGRLAVGAGEAGMSDEKREGASRWGAPSLVIDAQSTSCTAHDSLITLEGTQGPQLLTDEDLDKVNAGGSSNNSATLTVQNGVSAYYQACAMKKKFDE